MIVSAPTGAGKTYVFELLIKSNFFRGQCVYTVPTRALANDKYAEWQQAGFKVGLVTGDRSENPQAPLLVATLETQLERLLRGDGPDCLVMDEYQMLSDKLRGPSYEAALILAPLKTRLLLLSGSVENPQDVAQWLQQLGRSALVIETKHRPVPLDEIPLETLPLKRRNIESYWAKMMTAALMADLGPVLIFAPRRKDAESIARRLANDLPQSIPLSLSPAQKALVGNELANIIERRIAYHHSGLSYAARAGVIEPLAKAGQFRVIVSTTGLAAGINFSVRSVHVASRTYFDGTIETTIPSDLLLQMFGRAGRRGLDERGFVLSSRNSPTLADGRRTRLRRVPQLSWSLLLRVMQHAVETQHSPFERALEFVGKHFAKMDPEQVLFGKKLDASSQGSSKSEADWFGLSSTQEEMLNSENEWELWKNESIQTRPLRETFLVKSATIVPALHSPDAMISIAPQLGKLCKLPQEQGFYYGRELCLGELQSDQRYAPTKTIRHLFKIPPHIQTISLNKWKELGPEKFKTLSPEASIHDFQERGTSLWIRFALAEIPTTSYVDSKGIPILQPQRRKLSDHASEILDASGMPIHPQSGSSAHSWRMLGLIDRRGVPTLRGRIVSFFQRGEGLAISAAIEDPSYPLDELLIHLSNLRSDLHLPEPLAGSSERLGALCRATYGFVSHTGYLEAGLPVGYGESTCEMLGLQPHVQIEHLPKLLQQGDALRAYVEWLSLLRHLSETPKLDLPRYETLKQLASRRLSLELKQAGPLLHPVLPPLSSKQKHGKTRHYFMLER